MSKLPNILKLLLSPVLLLPIAGLGVAFHAGIFPLLDTADRTQQVFALGLAVYLPCHYLFVRGGFLPTFEHELTHMLFAKLFFYTTKEFRATDDDGGHVTHTGSNFLVSLAPYFFPTFTAFILPLGFLLQRRYMIYYAFLVGFTLMYHILSTVEEFGYRQSDIAKHGRIFSTLFVVFANLLCLGVVLALVAGGPGAVKAFVVEGFTWAAGELSHGSAMLNYRR